MQPVQACQTRKVWDSDQTDENIYGIMCFTCLSSMYLDAIIRDLQAKQERSN